MHARTHRTRTRKCGFRTYCGRWSSATTSVRKELITGPWASSRRGSSCPTSIMKSSMSSTKNSGMAKKLGGTSAGNGTTTPLPLPPPPPPPSPLPPAVPPIGTDLAVLAAAVLDTSAASGRRLWWLRWRWRWPPPPPPPPPLPLGAPRRMEEMTGAPSKRPCAVSGVLWYT